MAHTREGLNFAPRVKDPEMVAYALTDPESKCTTFQDGSMFIETGVGNQYFVPAVVAARGRELASRRRENKLVNADKIAFSETQKRVAEAKARVERIRQNEILQKSAYERRFRRRIGLIAATVGTSAVVYFLANGGVEKIAEWLK